LTGTIRKGKQVLLTIFAEELFEDYLACFTIHYIIVYTDQLSIQTRNLF